MYRPTVGGIGNLFIHLTQVDTVSDAVYTNNRGKYIRLEGVNVIPDDGTLPSVDVNTYIGRPDHMKISSIVKPTPYMQQLIAEHIHLVNGVEFAFQIRRCGLVKNQTVFKETTPNHGNFCTDDTLEVFYDIMNQTRGNVFVTSDCQDVKRMFQSRWPTRVRILDAPSVHTSSVNIDSDPMVPFIEFFLLSNCPFIFVTGGDPNPGICISTFGYMAAMYGNKGYRFIFNQ